MHNSEEDGKGSVETVRYFKMKKTLFTSYIRKWIKELKTNVVGLSLVRVICSLLIWVNERVNVLILGILSFDSGM